MENLATDVVSILAPIFPLAVIAYYAWQNHKASKETHEMQKSHISAQILLEMIARKKYHTSVINYVLGPKPIDPNHFERNEWDRFFDYFERLWYFEKRNLLSGQDIEVENEPILRVIKDENLLERMYGDVMKDTSRYEYIKYLLDRHC
ncbi:MAG: hypothetical protein OXI27_08790 [Thaumarchaeota archaeon]|nr:hypothetical protein [Nitrososphaerota archaeon]